MIEKIISILLITFLIESIDVVSFFYSNFLTICYKTDFTMFFFYTRFFFNGYFLLFLLI